MCKEEFFQSINKDTFFGYQFCRMLYGYSLYDPPFLDAVLDKFRSYGRGAVEYIYSCYLYCELRAEHEMLQPIGREIAQKIDRDYERRVTKKQWDENQQRKNYVQRLSDEELIQMLRNNPA